ncbi:S1C family serine protease [Selenomonas ruminantium]|uniref:S1C family serine protease n=1 Tax=Selenomonas ruminantium TaxID=971 RepID=UPI0026EB1A9B|nr:trypsin-like peptidase domain-containing protein [Selenomonas ruminantium]
MKIGKTDNRVKPILRRPWLIAAAAVVLVVAFLGLYYGTGAVVKNKAGSVYYLEAYDARNNFLASGSGFVIGNGYDLATNFHVIEGASYIYAVSADEQEEILLETVKAYDKSSDLAVLHSSVSFNAKPLILANSDKVRQGDRIYAIGYPLGLSNTLSDGIVSARYADLGVDYLQITAAISPGSSGGALLNSRGQVVGVVCAYYDGGQNLNVAITSNTLKNLYSGHGEVKALSLVS